MIFVEEGTNNQTNQQTNKHLATLYPHPTPRHPHPFPRPPSWGRRTGHSTGATWTGEPTDKGVNQWVSLDIITVILIHAFDNYTYRNLINLINLGIYRLSLYLRRDRLYQAD